MCPHPPQPIFFAPARERLLSPIGSDLPRCNNTGHEDGSGVETAHGLFFVAVFDYLQSERLKYRYKILTSWREPGFLLTCALLPPRRPGHHDVIRAPPK